MLKKLEIRDFAIIDRLSMEFGGGLNVFTGETGAGKSIIIEAIGFLLGERASADLVRTGATLAEVAGTFSASALPKRSAAAYGVKGPEFSVKRQIDAGGRTRGFFEGRPVTAAFLSGLGDALVDFHGQNEHQSLMKPEVQRSLLDRYGRLEDLLAECGGAFEERRRLLESLNAVSLSEEEKKRSLELYRFQLSEIEAAGLKAGEEEELQALYPRLKNAQKLFELSGRAREQLASGEAPASAALEKAIRDAGELAGLDEAAAPVMENLSQALILVRDAAETLHGYSRGLDTDPAALDQCLSRLDKISALKKKYGGSVDAALAFAAGLKDRITGLEDSALDKKELSARLGKAEARLRKLGEALHDRRFAAAKKLSAAVLKEISGLGFKEVKFSVSVEAEEDGFAASGMDTVEFLFSANPGYPLKPLKFTASGGEMSRVMLGLKSVLAASDDIPVLVFDEVDTGVGSTVGRLLGEKLARLARGKQLFCVTHMPQVAAFADAHFRVDKAVRDGVSAISVAGLDAGRSADEIARMLGGKQRSSELGLKHALELIKESRTAKGASPR